MNQKNNTSAFLYASKRLPFAIQNSHKNPNVEGDMGMNLSEVHTYYQPTCYGNFGNAFFKDSSHPTNGGVRARANCTHQMYITL